MSHPLLIISFVTLLVSYPALAHPSFDADDYRYARQAGDILSGRATVSEYLTITNTWETMWWYPRDYRIQYFRPTVIMSFLAEYLVWGLNPFWYVLANIVLSVAYSYLAYLFLRLLLKDEGYSLLAALLFAVHPGHVSTTYYISGLTDLLLGIFWLLSLYLYAKPGADGLHYRLSLVAFFLALLAKENAVTLIPIIVLFDALAREGGLGFRGALKSRYKAYLGYAGVFGLYYALRLMLIPSIFIPNYIYPYYYTPGMPGFSAHLAAITLLYLFNLTSGVFSPTFFTSDSLVLDNLLRLFILPTLILAGFVLLLA